MGCLLFNLWQLPRKVVPVSYILSLSPLSYLNDPSLSLISLFDTDLLAKVSGSTGMNHVMT